MSKFPMLSNPSYKTSPALSELQALPLESLSSIFFSISNQHGSIEFLSKVDLRGIVLDDIIKIQKQSVEVYKNSPPQGQGLNVKSRITLNTLALTPSQIKSQCKSMGAVLISHDILSGKTVFEVPHFTRYVFREDSDDSEEEPPQVHSEIDLESNSNLSRNIEIPKQVKEAKIKPETQNLSFSKRFKFSISPQGLVYLPGASGNLKAYQLDFDNEQAISGLEIQMSEIQNSNASSLFTTTHLENIWFNMGKFYANDLTFDGISNISQLWTLVNVLFGSPHVDITEMLTRNVPVKNEFFNEFQVQIFRKKAFMTWIKKWCDEELGDLNTGTSILKKIANGNTGLAAKEAIIQGYPRLGSLITLSPTEFTKAELSHQIDLWSQNNVFKTFQPGIALIYEILSGKLEKMPGYLTWKQKLSLVLQYNSLSYNTLDQIFEYFFQAFGKDLLFSCEFNRDTRDICYYLMKFYCNPSNNFSAEWLNPFTYQKHFSLGTSWLLFFSLYTLFEVSGEYKNKLSPLVQSVFDSLQFLTESFAEELVNSGRWQMALYVLKYSKNNSNLIRNIVQRNVYIDDLPIESNHISEFMQIIDAASALHSRQQFLFKNSLNRYIYANQPIQASDLIIQEIAPLYVIKYKGETLFQKLYVDVLLKVKELSDENNSIMLEEEIYIMYLKLANKLEQKWEPATNEKLAKTLGRIDKLAIKIMNLPKSSFHQQAAVSIMQKNLNTWKISLFQLEDKLKGIANIEALNSISLCQTEDIISYCETLGFRYLKSLNKLN